MTAKTRSSEGTAALDKALDVLDAVGASSQGLSQAELSARLALPRTTLYRLLGTLVARGLLRRDPLRRVYCLGFRCFEYARNAYAMPDLIAAAGVELRALRDMTGETTYLATLDGLESLSLERCEGAHSQRSASAVGERKPLHCTSQGKAMLAALPPERRDALVRELVLPANTPRTITDRRRLQAELRLTAQRGWSIDDEEIALGVRCCGAAILDSSGAVRGAISVAGPAFRLTLERLQLLGPEVAEAARRIGAQLAAALPPQERSEAQVVPGEWAFEGGHPVWTSRHLLWADKLAPSLHAANAAQDRVLCELEAPIELLVPWQQGIAAHTGASWQAFAADGRKLAAPPLPPRAMASACVAPDGTAWACQQDGDRWRVSELGAQGEATGGVRLTEPATDLAWSADGARLYLAAAGSGTLNVIDQRGQGALRRLATVPKGSGRLAGLAVDRDGGLWTALRGGWSVARFEPDGSMDRVVALPIPAPTGLAFGGEDEATLFVTSARDALDRESLEAAPLSGRLFAIAQAA
jgi:DNA-binding IclR family transcriptional regulator